MNITEAQIAAKRRELKADRAALTAEIDDMVATKSYHKNDALTARAKELDALDDALDLQEAGAKAFANHPLSGMGAADQLHGGGTVVDPISAKSGRYSNPMVIEHKALETVFNAAKDRQTATVKAFSTVSGLLPAQLDSQVLGKIHESRLLDRLPTELISLPSKEVIVHSSTTGAPGPVAEGALKPEVVLNTTNLTLTAVKLAAHVGISYETLSDFPAFLGYAEIELTRQLQDVENTELLSGSGTDKHMTGFLNTSGILTHDASTDTGTGVTVIDSLIKGIAQLRVGPALADANLLVLHPNTWSAIQRLKDTTGRFLFISANSDPSNQQANSILGVPVLTTTSIAAGAGLMLDTQKFGNVLIREGITIQTGQTTDDFTRNISRFVLEERLVLAVERPAAVLSITNLPTA
ncbi:phage major capsid protein [Mycobacterium yunnanensis]|uniref:Phage major capsid protein n=1 Tax=Mycobacterium yunnanensis TaxID=368477 RepID=A0A9X3C408_9MYCO|nr:phage major capsid protein [Mycobacterium yunnanensis]MCV7422992.1 phage major capsid protein [Mycobacterium yunnanensis]